MNTLLQHAVLLLSCLASSSLAAAVVESPPYVNTSDIAPSNSSSFSSSSPSSPESKKRFTLQQVANPDFHQPNVTRSLMQAYAKYGGREVLSQLEEDAKADPSHNIKFAALMQTGIGGTVNNNPAIYDTEYVCTVGIGTPPQMLQLNLDTGSADLWVYSSDTYPFQLQGQQLFYPENSTTSHRLAGETWSLKYGDGSGASGIVYTDRVSIGDTYFDTQAVQSAVQISISLSGDKFISGILGLGNKIANSVRPDPQLTYMDNIKDDLDQPLFTANLKKGEPGTYNFGYINKTEYTGDIAYAPVNVSSPYWLITVDGYQVGSSGSYTSDPWDAVVDTGTTLLLLPGPMVSAYYDQVPGAYFEPSLAAWIFPCSSALPDFIFGIGSYRGFVPGDYFKAPNVDQTHCEGGIQPADGLDFAIIGDYLLKALFVVFDYEKHAVGFANKDLGQARQLSVSRERESGHDEHGHGHESERGHRAQRESEEEHGRWPWLDDIF